MKRPAALIATAKVHPGSEAAYAAWQGRFSTVISKFPGFIGTDIIPPPVKTPKEAWTLIMNFESEEELSTWQRSPERGTLIGEVAPLLDGGDLGETISTEGAGVAPAADVTEVIFSKVTRGMADRYREWATRIQAAQAGYPGYRGMYLQPPTGGEDAGHWTSIIRYDSAVHLEAWMNAPERKTLLAETKEFVESEEHMRFATAFPGWVPIDPMTGEGPPNWKAAMLVLLGLFPIVMLEMKFLNLKTYGINASLAMFIGNVISVGLTSFLTMPLFVKWFEWWLFPKGNQKVVTAKGVGILCVLFTLEVLILGKLLPW